MNVKFEGDKVTADLYIDLNSTTESKSGKTYTAGYESVKVRGPNGQMYRVAVTVSRAKN